jgi:hypothetical protein
MGVAARTVVERAQTLGGLGHTRKQHHARIRLGLQDLA